MTDDGRLLQNYVRQGSQAAFSALAARHLNFVYSVCLRDTGDAALAEEVTQVVFLILARKARSLCPEPSLTGWLFQTARFAARNARRRASRRQEWEAKALAQTLIPSGEQDSLWDQIRPALNDALASLGAKDRQAVLLRFADGLSFPELGAALGTSEDAARMRLNRAIERLRQFFAKEGVTLSGLVLAGLLADRTVQAAPDACAASVARIAEIVPAGGSSGIISPQVHSQLQGVWKAMTISKLKVAATIGIGALLAGSLPFVTRAQNRVGQAHYKLAVSAPQAPTTPQSKSAMTFLDKAVQAEDGVQTGRLNLNYTGLYRRDTALSSTGSSLGTGEISRIAFDNRRQTVMVQGTLKRSGSQFRRRFSANTYQTFTQDRRMPQARAIDVNISKPEGYWPPYWPYDILRRRQWESWKSLVISGKLKAVMVSSDPITGQAILKLSSDNPTSVNQKLFVDSKHGYTLTRLQLMDKASGRNISVYTISYKLYAGGYWYPETIEHKSDGGQHVISFEKWNVKRVEINPSLTESDLGFGSIPAGANVHDNRENKPDQAK